MPAPPTERPRPARDGEVFVIRYPDSEWHQTWHPSHPVPDGLPHGSAGVCLTSTGEVVLISPDGARWSLPGGRPEGTETWEETLRREMLEEACATVVHARLLGFSRGHCVGGPEEGRVLVRAFWRADVELDPWEPRHEIRHRRLVAPADVLAEMPSESRYFAIYRRILDEAGVG